MKTIKADDVVSSFRFPFLAAHSARAKDDSRMPTAYDLQYPSIKFKCFTGFHAQQLHGTWRLSAGLE